MFAAHSQSCRSGGAVARRDQRPEKSRLRESSRLIRSILPRESGATTGKVLALSTPHMTQEDQMESRQSSTATPSANQNDQARQQAGTTGHTQQSKTHAPSRRERLGVADNQLTTTET
jgi:hypothetical protein